MKRFILPLAIVLTLILSGCYKPVSSDGTLAVVNALTGDVFYPETGAYVKNTKEPTSAARTLNDRASTSSGYNISTSVMPYKDRVLYKVTIEPKDSLVESTMEDQTGKGKSKAEVIDGLLSDIRTYSKSVTIQLLNSNGFQLASQEVKLSDAVRIVDSDGFGMYLDLMGGFEIEPALSKDTSSVDVSYNF